MTCSLILRIIFFALVLYKTTEAAVGIIPPEKKPPEFADQEGCFVPSLKLVLEVDVPYSPQDGVVCQQYTCKENGETQIFSCVALWVPEGCKAVDGDKTLPYPDCCSSTVTCTEEDSTDTDC